MGASTVPTNSTNELSKSGGRASFTLTLPPSAASTEANCPCTPSTCPRAGRCLSAAPLASLRPLQPVSARHPALPTGQSPWRTSAQRLCMPSTCLIGGWRPWDHGALGRGCYQATSGRQQQSSLYKRTESAPTCSSVPPTQRAHSCFKKSSNRSVLLCSAQLRSRRVAGHVHPCDALMLGDATQRESAPARRASRAAPQSAPAAGS